MEIVVSLKGFEQEGGQFSSVRREGLASGWAFAFAAFGPGLVHPYPEVRFDARYPRQEAGCGDAVRADLCGGRFVRGVPTATSRATMVYTRMLNRGGRGVRSPLDGLRKAVSSEGRIRPTSRSASNRMQVCDIC